MNKLVEQAYSNQSYVYFDIETIPCQDPAYLDALRCQVKAPARYSKQESIDKWLGENRERVALEAMDKTSFDAGLGHVCAVSWAVNDGPIHSSCACELATESVMLEMFLDFLPQVKSPVFVGHYAFGFDIPFITKRAVVLGVKLPPKLNWPRDPKAWDRGINDTMTMWAGSRDKISMDALCKILGIEGKGDFSGSDVAAAWDAGEHEKISEYCDGDVIRTRKIHQRFLAVGW